MYNATQLKEALIELFCSGADDIHDVNEQLELLDGIDYDALLQGLCNQTEEVYEYHAHGVSEKDLHYHGRPLLPAGSVLLYEDDTDYGEGAMLCRRSLELWLLSDMSFAVVSCFAVEVDDGRYLTEYRTLKGYDWTETGMEIDFLDLVYDLEDIADQVHEWNLPYYEL